MAIGGKEYYKDSKGDEKFIPFVSVHELEPGLPLLGSNDTMIKYIQEFDLQEENLDISDAIYHKIAKLKKNLKFAYKPISFFKNCVFNLEFVNSPRKLMFASDQKFKICLLELYKDYRLEVLKVFSFHDDIIQGIQIKGREIYTFSSDNTVSRIILEDDSYFEELVDNSII